MKNRRILILGLLAVGVVALGIVLALLLTPITSVLFGGTGEDFRNAGSCRPSGVAESPAPTDGSIIVVDETLAPIHPETTDNGIATPTAAPEATPAPTEDPYERLTEMADLSMMKDTINILLIGVDFSEERLTWNGKKEWHSDVMIVLSVNFAENRADLISLPRDTYAEIPGVKGIYKLNAAINCGGGLYNEDGSVNIAGLEKVCDAAEWMLGGIPVDYYYAVTMTSLKSLVDAFGGLDYDLDISFKIQGRSYQKGMQHMDGQAVLDYCRVRKTVNGLSASDAGDANRVNRQKRILVAFFEHMKKNNMIARIPDILAAFQGELFTNCTPAQTAALAMFAYNLDRDNIGLYSMSGNQKSLFQWNFVFTNQENRVKIIKNVYGVDVKEYPKYTLKYGQYRWGCMLYDQYLPLCTDLQKYVQKLIDEDDKLPETAEATEEPTATPETTPDGNADPTATPDPINITVSIVWDDGDDDAGKRPSEVSVKLMANGRETGWKGVLNASKNWEITFRDQPKAENGAAIAYTVEIDKDDPAYDTFKNDYTFRAENGSTKIKLTGKLNNANPASGDTVQTRKYTAEQRATFEEFKQALKDLKALKKSADSAAKKAVKGASNRLSSDAPELLDQLEKVQLLAIEVAKIFGYDQVKNFTNDFLPTDVGWNKSSPWAVNYGLDKDFNAVKVDFN